ncbi:LacI family DNA-binding transcriptional regulator [Streptomyces sp. NPDC097617]|uniref:LacI family DNA-binding transcriptional regulator n=1 Tax=Streptomyces sp. NPDC097617 TaxID=3366091 RepID=UPI00380143BD
MPGNATDHAREAVTRPTMKDVATAAGVGLKTVSRVVNGEKGVSEATAAHVLRVIEQLGFRRNDSARILRQGRHTGSVGLIIEDLSDAFYSQLSWAVEQLASAFGSLLLIGSSAEDASREQELATAFSARRVDGLIIVPTAADHRYLAPEMAAGMAVVSVDRPASGLDVDTVLSTNLEGALEAVAHLLRWGHQRIGFIGDRSDIFTAAERLSGYRQAMAEAGYPIHDSWVSMGALDPVRIRITLNRMFSGPEPVTALMCGNNRTTAVVLRELARFPHRLALVGFDDFEFADLLGITVVAQDPVQLGRTATELLFGRLSGEQAPSQRIEIPTRLILRGSAELPP